VTLADLRDLHLFYLEPRISGKNLLSLMNKVLSRGLSTISLSKPRSHFN